MPKSEIKLRIQAKKKRLKAQKVRAEIDLYAKSYFQSLTDLETNDDLIFLIENFGEKKAA